MEDKKAIPKDRNTVKFSVKITIFRKYKIIIDKI